ncbi:MAG: T9SS type A sorting domain-containing protein [Bacteroidetes bacterium]|nr:MAG: T9SS type A sorting domain-containing protein [Bacteroidota bacterium]
MKKIIILLLVISATALEAQNYQYFTAKQGIQKAMEIAKLYFNDDGVELYSIKCIRWRVQNSDHFPYEGYKVLIDKINPYNDSTGKSLYWYYLICNSQDSCLYFRIWNNGDNYILDSVFVYPSYFKSDQQLYEEDILLDTDSLVKCLDSTYLMYLNYSELKYHYHGWPFSYEENGFPVWTYRFCGNCPNDISELSIYINTKTCEIYRIFADVSEKNNNTSSFNIKSDPNTDNIIIESNSDLYQEAELRLYDQVGVLLFADKMNNKSYELSTYNYPSGLYLLQIKYRGNIITKTVMVVH